MPEDTREHLIVSLGERRYRVERPFGDLPSGCGIVSNAAVDSRGHIFVLMRRDSQQDAVAPGVVELGPDGSRIATWGEEIADGHMISIDAPQAKSGSSWWTAMRTKLPSFLWMERVLVPSEFVISPAVLSVILRTLH